MTIVDAMLPELDHELRVTRKLIERVPDSRASWKPHPKSTSMGGLAAHLASLAGWVPITVHDTELNVNPPGGTPWTPPVFESTARTLETFDAKAAEAREALSGVSDDSLMVPWSLKSGEHTVLTMPRAAVLRSFVINHMIHHRGQLSVYLRLNDVAVPAIYGPSADES